MVFSIEVFIIVVSLGLIALLSQNDRETWKRFIFIFIGVIIFEFLTNSFWVYGNLPSWTFMYEDISWVIALGWSSVILVSMSLVNFSSQGRDIKLVFLFYLIVGTVFGLLTDTLLNLISVKTYTSNVTSLFDGDSLFGVLPVESLLYILAFVALVITFQYFWMSRLRKTYIGGLT